MKKSRIAVVGGTLATLVLTLAPSAYANWSSSMSGVMSGFESSRWDDEQYSEIRFTGCDQGYATSVDVNLWEDVSLNYDNYKGDATFTNCFNSSTAVSAGEWHDLPVNDFYFKLGSIGGSNQMWARDVYIDTTAAD
ncbi:hypothetical protein OG978_26225 [Streptomyces sp. NBC_01591]|uniref:hypothetical protein n=1 Tax=Streptomyces sp. NBC_01591 TaxID=2975888 RepID=UPI002DD8B051|nr:hypothetical protein [Streptomyces sp. NBC_01591]WSD70567.1 hypothetical protein OG978_26225 [Streptomyces sp. NBC_01591]